MDLDTCLEKDGGVLRKLEESGVFSNKLIKDIKCPVDSSTSKSVVLSSCDEQSSGVLSNNSGLGKGSPIIGETLCGSRKIRVCFIQRLGAGGMLVGSSLQSNLSLSDFCSSECRLSVTGVIVPAKHFKVL